MRYSVQYKSPFGEWADLLYRFTLSGSVRFARLLFVEDYVILGQVRIIKRRDRTVIVTLTKENFSSGDKSDVLS